VDDDGVDDEPTEAELEEQPSFFQNLFGRFFSFGGGGTQGGNNDSPNDQRGPT